MKYRPSRLFSLLRRKSTVHDRVHERMPCCTIAKLDVVNHDTTLDGLLLELSRGGALFREASQFVLDRRGDPVILRVAGFSRAATIVNVRPEGYGLRWATPISDEDLQELCSVHQLDLALALAA
jgi:hypothetical protein